MRSILSTLPPLLCLLLLAVPATSTEPARLPKVADLRHSGSGCPQDARVTQTGDDFSELGFVMGSLAAETGTTRNCAVHFNAVEASPGWKAGLRKVYVTGWQAMPAGKGELEMYLSAFWSQDAGYTRTRSIQTQNTGARKAQTKTLVFDFGSDMLWSPCSDGDGYLGIFNSNFRVVAADGAYFGTKGSAKTTEHYEWEWKKC